MYLSLYFYLFYDFQNISLELLKDAAFPVASPFVPLFPANFLVFSNNHHLLFQNNFFLQIFGLRFNLADLSRKACSCFPLFLHFPVYHLCLLLVGSAHQNILVSIFRLFGFIFYPLEANKVPEADFASFVVIIVLSYCFIAPPKQQQVSPTYRQPPLTWCPHQDPQPVGTYQHTCWCYRLICRLYLYLNLCILCLCLFVTFVYFLNHPLSEKLPSKASANHFACSVLS